MKFDYVLMNPPFTSDGHRTFYREIIERMMKFANIIYFIGPTGVLYKNMWQKHKSNIIKAKRLGWDIFPVKVAIASALWVKTPTQHESRYCTFTINDKEWKIDKKDYPLRVPFVVMNEDEYKSVFDQNGVYWEEFTKIPQPGIYKDNKQELVYVYSDTVSVLSVSQYTNSRFIPIINPENGKKLAKVLSKLDNDRKIDGYWGRPYRNATLDLDPIRKDLLEI